MKGYYRAGGWLLFVAAVICAFAAFDRLKRRTAREDARYAAQRTEGMGDPLAVDEGDIDWARMERELQQAPVVYDVDDWPERPGGAA